MSFAAVVAGGVALTGTIISASQAAKQRKAAEAMSVQDPGYQGNPALERNASILRDRANNYTLPGSSQALMGIDRAAQSGFQAGVQGATSSNDVLDLATRMAYNTQSAENRLLAQTAQGEEQALMDYLNAEAAAGQESVNSNAWDRQRFLQREQQQADLTNAEILNTNNAYQSGLNTIGQVGTAKLAQRENDRLWKNRYNNG